jgi:hypothetical protein
MIRHFLIVLIIAASTLAATALACSCRGLPQTSDEARIWIEQSDLVALVYVEEYSRRGWVENSFEERDSYVRASIVRSFKGLPMNSEVYFDVNADSTCDARFQLRHTYLVFATGPGANARFETSMCTMGPFLADENDEKYEEHNKLFQRITIPTINAIEDALK